MDPEMTGTTVLNPESFVERQTPEETERLDQLRAQRAADREARRQAHLMATSGSSTAASAAAVAAEPDPEHFARAGFVTQPDVLLAATRTHYPDIDAQFLKEDIRRNKEQIDGWEKRATSVVDMLAEVQRKIDEATALDTED